MQLNTVAEIWWDFDAEDPDWIWCKGHATFTHREACEYILYIGAQSEDGAYWTVEVEQMRQGGCSKDFIEAYLAAKDAGAVRVIFYC